MDRSALPSVQGATHSSTMRSKLVASAVTNEPGASQARIAPLPPPTLSMTVRPWCRSVLTSLGVNDHVAVSKSLLAFPEALVS